MAHFLFVMCLTSYILNGTDPITTLYTCFEYSWEFLFSENKKWLNLNLNQILNRNQMRHQIQNQIFDPTSLLISTKDKLGKVQLQKGDIIMFDERGGGRRWMKP